jgi:adenylate cyclase
MLATNEAGLSADQRRWRREIRSAWLRLLAFAVLVVNLMASQHGESVLVHVQVIGGYGLATVVALMLALKRRGPAWSTIAFVVIDALLVVALFHEHLFAPGQAFDHSLTAPSLAVGFLLLTHAALRLRPGLVVLFSVVVLTGWLSLLAITLVVHAHLHPMADREWSIFWAEGALAAAFAFAGFVCYLLTKEHNVMLAEAVGSERRRQMLARFFSPGVVVELQSNDTSLALARRRAVVMFVDLRSFTRLSEASEPEAIAELLSEYRQLVTEAVFEFGGTVDKFIGDGVMAVFGHPQTGPDDSARAIKCGVALSRSLAQWSMERVARGKAAVETGIGLHAGSVIGGVLESGTHAEFTVFGDAVNVAERLERLCRPLDASLVVSEDVLKDAPSLQAAVDWKWKDAAELDGRRGKLRLAYLSRIDLQDR